MRNEHYELRCDRVEMKSRYRKFELSWLPIFITIKTRLLYKEFVDSIRQFFLTRLKYMEYSGWPVVTKGIG